MLHGLLNWLVHRDMMELKFIFWVSLAAVYGAYCGFTGRPLRRPALENPPEPHGPEPRPGEVKRLQ